ncbi:MAG: hypothetical protein NTW69_08625 [Chloroflexi bacterium]|nr:hypothetical protein [Chloroflexota bacterium]
MRLEDFDIKRGKAVLIGAVFLIWGVIILSFISNGYIKTWKLWHIPAMSPPFIDFRLIPGASETFRSGVDPAVSNPNDPLVRLFNYPKIWYGLFSLKISQDDTVWICIVLLVLFFLVLFAFPERIRVRDSLLLLFFIFSPACMLLYERGNVDLIFFILSGLIILTVNRWPIAAAVILLMAAFFKLFPFFGIIVFFSENKKNFYALFGTVAAIFLFYVLLNIQSVKASWLLTQRGTKVSYGVYVIFEVLGKYFRYYMLKIVPEDQIQNIMMFIPHSLALFLLVCIFFVAIRQKTVFPDNSERNLVAFRLGAAIYVGTFLLGNNWDYRMSFLLFVIPQLSQWLFASYGMYRWIYLGMFVVMLASFWDTVIFDYGILGFGVKYKLNLLVFDEIMNWSMF